ncbi:MAG: bifunctional (p)ppGpp synthetase/guanosine-3',5'-bis(diphosphate) 3'-pyrophosphohydrolase [Candidatus Caldatribacterium sp.]|nr:bifunctional (p)ppGpp synthetase/guanosine-3',5'-bis(diphosphate) 3'-pyrophosphohydrolase [Candidatus Caldatribacterium sp.]
MSSYHPDFDRDLVTRAYTFALQAHAGQTRLSGEPFFVHPLSVAHIVADLRMDEATIAAALLHDVLEDNESLTPEDLQREFGEEVTRLVQGVTKLNVGFSYSSKEETQVENYRRLFLAMAEDVRVIIIKLADRLHNMRTLKYQNRQKKEEIARETLEIFAPIAHRLGMYALQVELENLSLFFLDPEAYCAIQQGIERLRAEREAQIEEAKEQLAARLKRAGIEGEIQSRFKHIYSIYNKLRRQNLTLEDLPDLIALRVIVRTVDECYAVLGIVHSLWSPIEGRFKDYIAVPKSNMYQSLHTTVIGPKGLPMEIQIRTWDMHQVAEYGIAAHWKYKEGKTQGKDDGFDERMAWLRQILEWQQDLKSTREFMESLKISLFDDEVYVFTPKGDLKKLPKGSTPIDFAYLIHTEVGNTCVGARVNKKMVPLDYELKSGDIVEIITSRSSSGPSVDWLKIAKTPAARSKIRAFLRKKNQEMNRERGRELFVREMEKYSLTPEENVAVTENLNAFLEKERLKDIEDLYVAIGEGRYSARHVVNRIIPYSIRRRFQEKRKSGAVHPFREEESVIVQGVSNLVVRLARCCAPIPGDEIVAFVTQGKGITVHRKDCANLVSQDSSRFLDAEWVEDLEGHFHTGIVVEALDRPKLLADVSGAIANCQVEIRAVRAHTVGDIAHIHLVVDVRNREELEGVLKEIRKVSNVQNVKRGGVFSGR